MNSSQFMDKQIMDLSGSQNSNIFELLNPQEERHNNGGGGANKELKEEILGSYDFQTIRPLSASSKSVNLDGSNLGGTRVWNSADSKTNTSIREDDFGGDYSGTHGRRAGSKRSFGDLEDDEDDIFGSKKGNTKAEETAPGVATGMILSLRESLQNCKDALATCQTELEAGKSEIQKWHSAFQNEPAITAGISPEPGLVISYLQTLKSSEESLKEQLEKAKKKEAAFIVTFAKREQEIAELKSAVRDLKVQLKPPSMQARRLLLDPAIHEEFTRLKNLVEEKEKKVKELQDNVAAVNFTPQSKMGKMLMAKCRTLQEENEEIGTLASEGKIHELAMKLALQKSQNAELRNQFEGLHRHMEGLTDDVEKSNEMVLTLQQRLEEKDSEIKRLKDELYQKAQMEKVEDDSAGDKKVVTDEVNSGEAEC